MSILSLASAAIKAKSAVKAAKATSTPKPVAKTNTPPQPLKVGDVVVPETQASMGGATLPDTTKEYREELQTITDAKESEKQKLLLGDYEAFATEREFGKSTQSTFDKYFTGKSQESAFDTYSPELKVTPGIPMKARLMGSMPSELENAKKSIETIKVNLSEFNTPGNKIEANLKKTLGKKYDEFRENIAVESTYVDALRSDEELREDIPTFARSLYKGLAFDWIVDKATGGNTRAFNNAADFLNATGELDESGIVKFGGQLVGDAPVYLASSYFGGAAIGEGMVALGTTTNSARTAQIGLDVLKLQKMSPYLYAATFDSAFNTAAEYGVRKASGLDYTLEDGIRSAIMGAVVPKALGEVISTTSNVVRKGVDALSNLIKPKDLKKIDSIIKEGYDLGERSLSNIFKNNSDVKLSNGKTIGQVLDELPKSTKAPEFNEIDVSVGLSNNGVSVSSMAAKRLATFVKEANAIIDNGGKSNEAAMALNDVMTNVAQKNTHNEASIISIIESAEVKNGVKTTKKSVNPSSEDVVSDLLHTPEFELSSLKNSSSMEDVYKAFTKTTKTSVEEIDTARVNIEIQNRGGAKSVEELANREGIKFDWKKAIDEFGTTNKKYLTKVLDDVESKTIGYTKYSKKLLGEFKDKVNTNRANLKTATKFDAIGIGKEAEFNLKSLNSEVLTLTAKLKAAANVKEKDSILATIAKKNSQIIELKNRFKAKEADRRAIATLIKNEVDNMAKRQEFAMVLSPSEIKSIKDAHKVRIIGKTTEDDAQAIVDSIGRALYKAAYTKISNSINSQIKKVNKVVNSKTKKSKIDPFYVDTMNELVKNLELGDLRRLIGTKLQLDELLKEGKNSFAESRQKLNFEANENFVKIVNEMGGKKIMALGYNSPEFGAKKKDLIDNVITFFGNNVQSHWYIPKMMGEGSTGELVFSVRPTQSYSSWFSQQLTINNKLVPSVLDSIKGMESNFDSVKAKYTLWRLRNSGANEWNVMNKMGVKLNKDGKWEISTVNDDLGKGFNKFHELGIDERQSILDSIYKEFDNEFGKNADFNKYENELRSYFDEVGTETSEILRTVAGKRFSKNNLHHPAIRQNSSNNDSMLNANSEYSQFQQDVLNDGFMNTRHAPKDFIELNLDFQSNMQYHTNTALYWGKTVSSIIDMEKTLLKLKSGEVSKDFTEHLASLGKGDNESDKILDAITNLERFLNTTSSEGSQYLTREAEALLKTHIGKFATRGNNIRGVVGIESQSIVGKVQKATIPMVLGGIKSALKQTASYFDSTMYGGASNSTSAIRSSMDMTNPSETVGNIREAMEVSGLLFERQPDVLIHESRGRHYQIQGKLSTSSKFAEVRDASGEVGMTMMKTIDGMASTHAWFTGLSKYLDEAGLKKSGSKIIINELRNELTPQQFKDAVGYADVFMSKIMGSNQLVHAGVDSQGAFAKGVFYMGKTALNHSLLLLDQAKRVLGKDERFKSYPDRLLAAAYLSANLAMTYQFWQAIDEGKDMVDVFLGAKDKETLGQKYDFIGNKVEEDSYWYKTSYLLQVMLVTPSSGVDLTKGLTPLTSYFNKLKSAPTLGRKAEEAGYIALQGLTNVHKDYINIPRKFISSLSEYAGREERFTNVDNATYDKAAASIIGGVTPDKPTLLEMIRGETKDGVKLPTREDIGELMDTQKGIMESSGKINEEGKAKTEMKDEFINNFIKEYPSATKQDFVKYAKANKSTIDELGITTSAQVVSLYTIAETKKVKSKGGETSILMGKPARVIFEVKILPLIEKGDKRGAIEEVKRLKESGVIKSESGLKEIVKLMNQY